MTEELYRYFEGSLSEEEERVLFRQIDADSELKKEFADLQNTLALSSMLKYQGDGFWSERRLRELKRMSAKNKERRFIFNFMKYAAVVLLIIGSWFLSQHQTVKTYNKEYTWIEAPKGQRVSVKLADGSSVILNPSSRLRVPNAFESKQREVLLEGEGFFKVAKNPSKPFIVATEKYNVRVFGTEFNVFAYPQSGEFETELVQGSVYVYDKDNDANGIYMKANEKVALKEGKLCKVSSIYRQYQLVETGIYDFSDVPFKNLLTRLGLWYHVRFQVDRPEVLNQIYQGKFRQSDDIETIMNAIRDVGKFNYKIISEYVIEIY